MGPMSHHPDGTVDNKEGIMPEGRIHHLALTDGECIYLKLLLESVQPVSDSEGQHVANALLEQLEQITHGWYA